MCANAIEKINDLTVLCQYHGTVTYQMSITDQLDSFLDLDMSDLDMPIPVCRAIGIILIQYQ